ncbi:MAG: hypothetical protein IPM66_13675 [Acidobacteriota bacterium]|nr:MAG: hypothetical protein IPM66_13675 [Acidobacteriota bacterium]
MDAFDSFTLTPLSAGDIIDRAVRIYRRNFPALLRIVLAPSLIAYAGGIMYYIGIRNFSLSRGDTRVLLTASLIMFGGMLWLVGKVAFYAMLGGASKSLIYLFFDGTPLQARDVYRTVRKKFGGLITATILVAVIVVGVGFLIYMGVLLAILIYISAGALVAGSFPRWLTITLNIVFGLLLVTATITVLLAVYSRIVYVPQVLMVEEKSASGAIGRSFSLAGGEVRRIGVLILFWFYIAWSFWLLLMIPLGAWGYWTGIDLNPFNLDVPIWFNIAQQTVAQISEIIIAPIAIMGFTLLYLDSRVRKEGFDVELMANRLLAPPAVMPPPGRQSPVHEAPPREPAVPSILGDISPEPESPVVEPVVETPPVAYPEPAFVEAPRIEIPAPLETTRESEPAVSPVIPEIKPRVCRWCETGADAEDRFCRVCGAVF